MKITDKLNEAKQELKIREEVLYMNKKKIMNELENKKEKRHIRFIPVFATSLLLVFSLLATSVLAFPGIAAKVAPNLPLVKQVTENEEILGAMSVEIEAFKETDLNNQKIIEDLNKEVESLKIRIKEISDEKIKEVETSVNEDEAQNLQIQSLVIEFVKEMYKGNYVKAAKYCTEEFSEVVLSKPDDVIMRPSSTVLVFTQITNVAKVNDSLFLVFLRLNDSGEEMEADYQLDFEISVVGDKYLISFVGIDA